MRLAICCWLLSGFLQSSVLGIETEVGERFLDAVRDNRSSSIVFEYHFRRESPLLEQPLDSTYQVRSHVSDDSGSVVTLRPNPEVPAELLRSDVVWRSGELLIVNTTVEAEDFSKRSPDGYIGIVLSSPSLSGTDRAIGQQQLLNRAPYNLALGVMLGLPIERYFGSLSNRRYVRMDEALELNVETEFGVCQATWPNTSTVYPSRITLQLGADDKLYDRLVSEVSMGGGKGWPKGGIESVTSEIFSIRAAGFSGKPVPVEWVSVDTYNCKDGSQVVERCDVTAVYVDFDAVAQTAGEVVVELPLKHSVTVQDATHLEYYWNGDWAAPSIALLTAPAETSHSRYLVLINLIFLAIITVGFFVWLWHRRGKN